ncbi:hypothetical protein BD413DRAFT_83437 [Trametes elegans]|nr:hypothetical protein BD413DRAFT_83437 [Trametes elegans]
MTLGVSLGESSQHFGRCLELKPPPRHLALDPSTSLSTSRLSHHTLSSCACCSNCYSEPGGKRREESGPGIAAASYPAFARDSSHRSKPPRARAIPPRLSTSVRRRRHARSSPRRLHHRARTRVLCAVCPPPHPIHPHRVHCVRVQHRPI